MTTIREVHPFPPAFQNDSKILILGTFPSVKSRENAFYYGNKYNRFWTVLASVYKCSIPITIEDKQFLLKENKIALWDVIKSCEIIGSSDSSIKNVVPNDLTEILNISNIHRIYANGQTAGKLYKKYIQPATNKDITILPSTSPANASFSLDRLIEEWGVIG